MQEVRTILLGLLRRAPLQGQVMRQAVREDRLGDWALVSAASLYLELRQMAQEGLIAPVGELVPSRPALTTYRLTQPGEEALRQGLKALLAKVDETRAPQELALRFSEALSPQELADALRARLAGLTEALARAEKEESAPQPAQAPAEAASGAQQGQRRIYLQNELIWTRDLLTRLAATRGAQPIAPSPPRQAWRKRSRTGPGEGAFTFVLHSHFPYARLAGRWPHGEEWIHEAAAETYLPLLNALYDLRDQGVAYKLTLGLTPVLTEQLADADMRAHFVEYLDDEIAGAEQDLVRFIQGPDRHLEYLAGYYRDFYTHIKESFLQRFGSDIIGAFRRLQDEGYIEIITCAATHGYLPLLARDSSIYGQLRTGVASYMHHFGRAPRAIWLPECAYRPAYQEDDGTIRPALEEFLAPLGLCCFFVETHAIEGGRPVGKAAGDVAIGPYTAITRRYVIPMAEGTGAGGTTFRPYYVSGSGKGLTEPPVAAIGRNNRTGQQVWSADWGYPGEADYREFHRKDEHSGLQYWRVTGPRVDLGLKDYYHPDWAAQKVDAHANHFATLVEELAQGYHRAQSQYGLIASNYDTELFGHWWFEGIAWIREVLRELAQSDAVDLVTASEYLTQHEPEQVMAVPESSWGVGGTHWTWDNPETSWMWGPIHEAERRIERLVERYPAASGATLLVLNQAARELLLLESSDWPFLVTTGQAKEYATKRFHSHVERFNRLAELVERGDEPGGQALAEELYELDKVFPDIDYRWFAPRQGNAGELP